MILKQLDTHTQHNWRRPMGMIGLPDISQDKMSPLMETLEYVHVYIDDLLTITKGTFQNHLSKLRQVLFCLHTAGFRVNANKSSFAQRELEYLGYILPKLTHNGGDHPYCDIALSMMEKQMQQEHCHLCYLSAALQTDKFVNHFFKQVEEGKILSGLPWALCMLKILK